MAQKKKPAKGEKPAQLRAAAELVYRLKIHAAKLRSTIRAEADVALEEYLKKRGG